MGFLTKLLTLPALGGPRLVQWVAGVIAQEADQERLDQGRVRGLLLELQERFEAGQMSEEEYEGQEKALLERLSSLRETQARGQRQTH